MDFQRFEYNDDDFQYISNLMQECAGIQLAECKRELVYGRLTKRLRALNLDSFAQYCQILKEGDKQELIHCVNQITTNVTSFFRENHHFDYMANTALPKLLAEKTNNKTNRLRIWSAGCSSGEEAYSIAITLRENELLTSGKWDAKILATDLDSNILDKARKGIYKIEQLENISEQRRIRCFQQGRGDKQGLANVTGELKDMISFKQLNLSNVSWPMHGPFDVIFCRNVVIYFDKEMRKKLINRFADLLDDGGYLFVGHSESLFGITDRFTAVGHTMHMKTEE